MNLGNRVIQEKNNLQHDTLLARVTNRLRKLILTNQIQAGERIKQDEIAQLLGVSRTPVREAIRQLETEGLITTLPYKGAVVASVNKEELEDIYQIRIALEAQATKLACENMTEKDIQALEQIVAKMNLDSSEERAEKALEINRSFYKYLFALSGHSQLFELTMSYLDKANRFRQQFLYNEELHAETLLMHEQIIHLFREGDIDKIVTFTTRYLYQSLAEVKRELCSVTQT